MRKTCNFFDPSHTKLLKKLKNGILHKNSINVKRLCLQKVMYAFSVHGIQEVEMKITSRYNCILELYTKYIKLPLLYVTILNSTWWTPETWATLTKIVVQSQWNAVLGGEQTILFCKCHTFVKSKVSRAERNSKRRASSKVTKHG